MLGSGVLDLQELLGGTCGKSPDAVRLWTSAAGSLGSLSLASSDENVAHTHLVKWCEGQASDPQPHWSFAEPKKIIKRGSRVLRIRCASSAMVFARPASSCNALPLCPHSYSKLSFVNEFI